MTPGLRYVLGWVGGALVALAGCSAPSGTPVKYLIGVSQANLSEPWRVVMTDEVQRQASLHPDLRVIVTDASDSLGKQIGDIEKFEGLGVDLMIISPLDSEALTPTVTRIYQKLPVIVVNRSVANYDYTLFIGPDNARIGREAGRFVARTLANQGGEVLEVLGRSGSPPTLERAQGFRQEIAKNPRIELQSPVLANWLRDGAEDLVLERLRAEGPPRVIFAHNDAMAYGAWLAAKTLGLDRQITFLGVDGLPGTQGGMELLRTGILDATFVSPTGGKEAVEYALAILQHQGELPKKVILGTRLLTRNDLPLAAGSHRTPVGLTVGYLASTGQDSWRQRLAASVRNSLAARGWSVVELGPGEALPGGLDAVVVDATDAGADDRRNRTAVEAAARTRGLALFRLGPQPPGGNDGRWTTTLGPDPGEEGRRAGRWAADHGYGRLLELTGPLDAAGTSDRSEGLALGVGERTAGRVVARVATDGSRESGRAAVTKALASGLQFDAVFAHDDELSLGALDVRQAGAAWAIIGVGGGPEALKALGPGGLACLVRSPTDLGNLLASEVARDRLEPGITRQLVTSHDVVAQ